MAYNYDVTIDDEILYFDPEVSYEITGYRPITASRSLDFDPEWFREAAKCKIHTGRYTTYSKGSKKWREFWDEERERCMYGMEKNGYRITGDNYFFINYYCVPTTVVMKDGTKDRAMYPSTFLAKQYEYFHYIEMARRLELDICALKSRGVGFSEMSAAIGANIYTHWRKSNVMYTAFAESYLVSNDGVLKKVWEAMDYLNEDTDGAFKHVRQVSNTTFVRRASKKTKQGEELPSSFKSQVVGVVADNPRKVRGARSKLVVFEEAGSYKNLIKSWGTAEALTVVLGDKIGTRMAFGTGGDEGDQIEGLIRLFNAPETFGILPYRHNHTLSGDYAITSYFFPVYSVDFGFLDSRGVADQEAIKIKQEKIRETKKVDPDEYRNYCAEYCMTPDEAFSKQGMNNFDQVLLANQWANIALHKSTPEPIKGYLHWVYDNKGKIIDVRWEEHFQGNIRITEPPGEDNMMDLYVGGIDSIDKGDIESTAGESRFCCLIKKRTFKTGGDQYVAMYLDRPQYAKESYETAMKMLYWYKCKANIEDSRVTIVSYFRNNGQASMLYPRPRIALGDKFKFKQNSLIGTPATKKLIQHGLNLVKEYIDDYCQNIFYLEMITQLQEYSYEAKTKFDIIAAMQMCEIYDEDLAEFTPKRIDKVDSDWEDIVWKRVNGKMIKTTTGEKPPEILTEEYNPVDFIENGKLRWSEPSHRGSS